MTRTKNRRRKPAKINTKPVAEAMTSIRGAHRALGLTRDAANTLEMVVQAQEVAEDVFDVGIFSHADWALVYILLQNELASQATVAKHVIHRTGRSPGTIRTQLRHFEERGHIVTQQRIGRSELYRPTQKLKVAVNRWARRFMHEYAHYDSHSSV